MIRAHIASFPPRLEMLLKSLDSISTQVDKVFLVLNDFTEIPAELDKYKKLECIMAESDTKDVGKFYFKPNDEDIVFFVDDDIQYKENYVEYSLDAIPSLETAVYGYHSSIYLRPKPVEARRRRVFHGTASCRDTICVDQVATNSAISLGKNIPSFEYMEDSQMFVDVRYSKWCHENGIRRYSIKRDQAMIIQQPEIAGKFQIWTHFTAKNFDHVNEEIRSFARKDRNLGKTWDQIEGNHNG